MEALTAVSIAALTIYDMCKGVDTTLKIDNIRLTRKRAVKAAPWCWSSPNLSILC